MIVLRIASLRIGLEGLPAGLPAWEVLAPFEESPAGAPDLRLRCRVVPGHPHPEWKGDADFEDLPDGAVAFRRQDFEGRFDPASGLGEVEVCPHAGSLRATLRFSVALALLERDGFLLHAAGLSSGGTAHVLCGPSGAGKSTAAALSQGRARILSSELCGLLRGPGGGWQAWGTPFAAPEDPRGSPEGAPLAALALIEQSARAEALPVGPSEAVRRLYPQILRPSRRRDRHARWLDLAAAASREVPCFRLGFRKDASFWKVLQAGERAA